MVKNHLKPKLKVINTSKKINLKLNKKPQLKKSQKNIKKDEKKRKQ